MAGQRLRPPTGTATERPRGQRWRAVPRWRPQRTTSHGCFTPRVAAISLGMHHRSDVPKNGSPSCVDDPAALQLVASAMCLLLPISYRRSAVYQ